MLQFFCDVLSHVVCGERLNPTGKKKLKTALKEERYDELVVEAIKQEQAGAHVLDVNVGLPGIDEPKVIITRSYSTSFTN